MSTRPSTGLRALRLGLALGLAAWPSSRVAGAEGPRAGGSADARRLVLVERSVIQDQGGWRVDYRLRHEGESTLVVPPAEVVAQVDGWVSNSRVASHAVARASSLVLSGSTGLSGVAEVIGSADESQRCRERATLQVWTGDDREAPPAASTHDGNAPIAVDRLATLRVAPGGLVRARLRLEHQHFLFGSYDPLLGQRTVSLRLGAATFRDLAPLETEQYLAMPAFSWPSPPEERRDTRYFVSAPDSLHLEAHVSGNQYYRFPDRPVRYATRMRLRFWYLIAAGTEGECRARVSQYKDTPTAWKVLTEGAHEQTLCKIGRWVKVERIFRTEPDATTLALDFQIYNPDRRIGEMWIDDVSLEPVAAGPAGP